MIYTFDELKSKITPIAHKYSIPAVYIFGSYARGEATDNSDVDVLIEREGSIIKSLFDMGALQNELNETLGKPVDLITTDSVYQPDARRRAPRFAEVLEKERLVIYER